MGIVKGQRFHHMTQKVPHEKVHEQLDPHFFLDYALFSGTLRHYVAKSLEDLFKADRNDVHRRFFVIGLYREEYAAYEDMGAILEAFIRFRLGDLAHPIEGILRYKDDKVVLQNLFRRRSVKSADDLYVALGLQDWIPPDWPSVHPGIDCERALRRMCQFMFTDCMANQKRYGIDAYNRIKHGLALVPNGGRYLEGLPNAPAVVIKNPQPDSPNPYVLYGLPMGDSALEERLKLVKFIQSTLRSVTAFYVIGRYPDFLRDKRQISPASALFNTEPLLGAREFMRQLSEKSDVPTPQAL